MIWHTLCALCHWVQAALVRDDIHLHTLTPLCVCWLYEQLLRVRESKRDTQQSSCSFDNEIVLWKIQVGRQGGYQCCYTVLTQQSKRHCELYVDRWPATSYDPWGRPCSSHSLSSKCTHKCMFYCTATDWQIEALYKVCAVPQVHWEAGMCLKAGVKGAKSTAGQNRAVFQASGVITLNTLVRKNFWSLPLRALQQRKSFTLSLVDNLTCMR